MSIKSTSHHPGEAGAVILKQLVKGPQFKPILSDSESIILSSFKPDHLLLAKIH